MVKSRQTATPSHCGATGDGRNPAVARAIARGLAPLVRIADEQGYRFLSYLLSMALFEARVLSEQPEQTNGSDTSSGLLEHAKRR